MSMSKTPAVLRVEVKFTTSTAVQLPEREHAALKPDNDQQVGVLASLFWNDDSDGHWLLVDQSSPALRSHVSLQQSKLRVLATSSKHLEALQDHVTFHWRAFLEKNLEAALGGHEELSALLADQFEHGCLLHGVKDQVLEFEHTEAMNQLLAKHGEKQVGIVFQDLLCYLLASAGYSHVQNNPIGVPDIMLSVQAGLPSDHGDFTLRVKSDELERLIKYCEDANDTKLASLLSRCRVFRMPILH